MLRVKRNLCSSQVSFSNLSFLLFVRLTVPRDLVQKLSALWRPHQNCPSFSRQLELPIRFVLFSLVWAWAVSDWKNGAFNLVHFTVGAQFEKADINRIESVRIAGANRQQRSSIAMMEKRDVKLGLATVDNATDVTVLFVDIFVTRFGIAQVKLAAAGSRVLQQPRCRPVFKLISWQQ